ncbi:hypothetical protein [Pseudarthrobacter siccitolerans]
MSGQIGDQVGYVVVKQDRWGGWDETNSVQMETCSQAVGMVKRYREDNPAGTYAVARLQLVMISRPEEAEECPPNT